MTRRLTVSLVVLLTASSLSCWFFMVGDGGMVLTGEVVTVTGTAPDDCELTLYTKTGYSCGTRQTGASIQASFVIAPGGGKYYAGLRCLGCSETYTSAVFKTKGHREPIDLGKISVGACN